MRAFLGFLILSLSLAVQAQQPATGANCVFSYQPASLKVFWTGYKFTEKVGVKGEFTGIKIDAPAAAKTADELIQGTSVVIDTTKFETGDPARNANILYQFFKKIKGPTIEGKVTSYNPAILKVQTKLNGISKSLAFRVHIDGNKYKAETDFDMIDLFKMKGPHDAISKACNIQHRGKDGKSKTWTQVSLALEAEIVNSCVGATGGN